MSLESVTSAAPVINIQAIMNEVADSTTTVTCNMVNALSREINPIFGLPTVDFKELAERNISKTIVEDLDATDKKTMMVYNKLFEATLEHIKNNSKPLFAALTMINVQTNDKTAADRFIASFVLPEAKILTEKLQKDHPAALENEGIWK